MRYALVLVFLASACSRWWIPDEEGGVVADALRASATGDAVLVAPDRVYLLRDGALQEEIADLSGALARAAETEEPDGFSGVERSEQSVVAFAYPGRTLEFATRQGFIVIQRAEGGAGTRYWATLNRGTRKHLYLTAKGTADVDGAWERLETAAATQAGETMGPSVMSGLWPGEMQPRHVVLPIVHFEADPPKGK